MTYPWVNRNNHFKNHKSSVQPKYCCDISIASTYPSGRPIHWCDLFIGDTYSLVGPIGLGPIHWHDLFTDVIPECMWCNHLFAIMSTNCFINIKKYKESSYRIITYCQQRKKTIVNATAKINVFRNITTFNSSSLESIHYG